MSEFLKQLGGELKAARLKKKLSQRAVSEKTKITQTHISKIENGEVDLQASTLFEMARALGLEPMLVPAALVPTFQALLREGRAKQTPMYQLDPEEGDD